MKIKLLTQNFVSSSLLPLGIRQRGISPILPTQSHHVGITWWLFSLSPSLTQSHHVLPSSNSLFWRRDLDCRLGQDPTPEAGGWMRWGWVVLWKQKVIWEAQRTQSRPLWLHQPQTHNCTPETVPLMPHDPALEPLILWAHCKRQINHQEKESGSQIQTNEHRDNAPLLGFID